MKNESVSVVIPALNEEEAVGDVVRGLMDALSGVEIIVVDDGSTDRTAACAEEAGARVIQHDRCSGYGASLRTGAEACDRDYILFCDADGQHSASDAAKLVGAGDGYDLVIGERGKDSHVPLDRRPGKIALAWLANKLAGEKIPDLNCGLRLFKRDTLMRYIHLMPEGFSFSTTSTFVMLKARKRMRYVPVKVGPRKGTSTVRQVRHGLQTIMLMLRLVVLFEPLRIFLRITAVLAGLTFISILHDVFYLGLNITETTVILGIATLIVFMFGLLCDQVSAMRRELHAGSKGR